jgi:hypothetical protein
MQTSGVKLGLFLPSTLHRRVAASCRAGGIGTAYAQAFIALLDQLDAGEPITFAAVRVPKTRITVRLEAGLNARLRARITGLNLKITDFACTAAERALTPKPGA